MRDLFAMNCGTLDRGIRVAAGLLILSFAPGAWSVVGFVPLVTGAIGWCPLYLPFGMSTT